MYKTGSKTIKVGEREYHFHFGMNARDIYQRMVNPSLGTVGVIKCLLFGGLMARQKQNELPDNYTLEEVGDLIDEMQEEDFNALKEMAFESLGFTKDLTVETMPKLFPGITQEQIEQSLN